MAASFALLAGGAAAFDPEALSEADRSVISTLLEYDRTNASRDLPSGGSVTVRQTQTRPQICRFFIIDRPDATAEEGVGCRVGTQQWALSEGLPETEQETVPSLVEAPEVRPGPPRRDDSPSQPISVPETVTATVADIQADGVPLPPSRSAALTPEAASSDVVEVAEAPFEAPLPPLRPQVERAPIAASDPASLAGEGAEPEPETLQAPLEVAEGPGTGSGQPLIAGIPVPLPPLRGDGTVRIAQAQTEPASEGPAASGLQEGEPAQVAETPPPAQSEREPLIEDQSVAGEGITVTAESEAEVTPGSLQAAVAETPLAEASTEGEAPAGLTASDQALAPFQAEPPPPTPGAVVPEGAAEIIIVTDSSDTAGQPTRTDGFEALLARLTGDPTPDAVEETAPPIVSAESVLREAFVAPLPPRRPTAPAVATTPSPADSPAIATTGFPLPPIRPEQS